MASLVSIMATGDLNTEIDLSEVAESIDDAEYEPEIFPAMYLQLGDMAKATVFRSGKFNISGASSFDELNRAEDNLMELFEDLGIELHGNTSTISNLVYAEEYDVELNLEEISVELGMEEIEYEPEQFPGLMYRMNDSEGLLLIFSSGKVILTGIDDEEAVEPAFEQFEEEILRAE